MKYSGTDLDFAKDSLAAIRGDRIVGANLLLFMIISAVVAAGIWASRASLEEVTRGEGKVIPSTSIQTIQNLEGGILAELSVREGQFVRKGDTLARIDDTMTAATYRENVAQRDALEARRARLLSEATGAELIEFSDRILEARPDLVKSETELFLKHADALSRRREVVEKSLRLASEELEITVPLVARKVAAKVDQLRLERDVNELQGKLDDLTTQFQEEAMEAFNETKTRHEAINESVQGHEDRVKRAIVVSPVDGVVNEIHVTTTGGVIQPGEVIMDIVPEDETLLIQAKILPSDIGFLHAGQQAVIKFTAYDYSIYGGLDGIVEHISADTIQDEIDRQHYYQIKVRNEHGSLQKDGEQLPIIPGMVAEVDILTGERTVLQYLLKPFNKAWGRALRER
ncbi:MAG: HlyD family type I secretion periplasmic adaptor subunit [Verrucomicrobiota bacterium]